MTNKHFYDQTVSTSMSEYVLFAYRWKHFKNGYFEMGLILINFVMQMHKTKHVKIDLILSISTTILDDKLNVVSWDVIKCRKSLENALKDIVKSKLGVNIFY